MIDYGWVAFVGPALIILFVICVAIWLGVSAHPNLYGYRDGGQLMEIDPMTREKMLFPDRPAPIDHWVDMLHQFHCGTCSRSWSIRDAPMARREWYCPWCGRQQNF